LGKNVRKFKGGFFFDSHCTVHTTAWAAGLFGVLSA